MLRFSLFGRPPVEIRARVEHAGKLDAWCPASDEWRFAPHIGRIELVVKCWHEARGCRLTRKPEPDQGVSPLDQPTGLAARFLGGFKSAVHDSQADSTGYWTSRPVQGHRPEATPGEKLRACCKRVRRVARAGLDNRRLRSNVIMMVRNGVELCLDHMPLRGFVRHDKRQTRCAAAGQKLGMKRYMITGFDSSVSKEKVRALDG